MDTIKILEHISPDEADEMFAYTTYCLELVIYPKRLTIDGPHQKRLIAVMERGIVVKYDVIVKDRIVFSANSFKEAVTGYNGVTLW